MTNNCFEIGTIQAFLDGELASDLAEKVVKHMADCDHCAFMMNEAKEEDSFAFAALGNELNVLVPTERLRTKVFTAIEEIERAERVTWWETLSGSFAFLREIDFKSPSFVAVACTVLFVGTFAIALKVFPPMPPSNEVAVGETPVVFSPLPGPVVSPAVDDSNDAATNVSDSDETRPDPGITKKRRWGYQKLGGQREIGRSNKKRVRRKPKPKAVPAVIGEDIYLQTIATLGENVNRNKDEIFRPKERIAFEKNLALVNGSIKRMKTQVRKNPKNKAAKELLKASYQNKIDLLNSVSERNEMIASMQ